MFILDLRGITGGRRLKVGSACKEFEEIEGGLLGLFVRVVVVAQPGCRG